MNHRARPHPRALALALLLLLGCDSPTAARPAFAYDPTTLTRGQVYRWPSGRRILVWTQLNSADASLDLARAVRQSMGDWNSLTQFAEFELTAAASAVEADVIVYDRATPLPVSTGSCVFDPQNSAGYTYFCPTGTNPTTAQRLTLSPGPGGRATVVIRVDRGRVADQTAYQALVSHEIGHALGIGGHSDQARDLMFGAPSVSRPSVRDAQTLRYLLGLKPDITL